MLISVEELGKNQMEPSQDSMGIVTFFAKKCLTKTDRCAGALL
jgi:hypothetical protein